MIKNVGENQWKVNEAAKMIDESQHVVRHWLKELGQYIPTKKGENGYRYFDEEAMESLRIVQRLTRD
ncbi:MerR family transcriptional regulator, partial [Janthinobacterium lividum]|uniref:MerR family transcriptional regulator n=1 Tax=Janthinobacterium lividum TaxID=29581 RepID=UPI0011132129